MGMSEFYGEPATARRSPTIHRALELGVTSSTPPTCTARSPTSGWSAARSPGRRDEVVLATKFGNERGDDGTLHRDQRPARLRAAGLRRVARAPRHRHDRPLLPAPRRPEHADRGDLGRAEELVDAGKVRYLGHLRGRAGDDPPRRTPCIRSPRCSTEYSLWTRDPEDEVLPTARELGIGFVAYSPLGRGFLSGQIAVDRRPRRRRLPPPQPPLPGREFRARTSSCVDRVEEIADREGRHRLPARARLGARTERRRRPDPGHETRSLPRGERRRCRRSS